MENKLSEQLTNKISKEYHDFIDGLKTKSPDEIIRFAYEVTYKAEIVILLESASEILNEAQIKNLLKENYPLEILYRGWMKTDASVSDILIDSITFTANNI